MPDKVGGHAGQRERSHVAKEIRMGVTAHTLPGTPPMAGQQTAGWDGLNERKGAAQHHRCIGPYGHL